MSHCQSSGHGSSGAKRIVLATGKGAGGPEQPLFRECTANVEEKGLMKESRGEGHVRVQVLE